VPSLTATTDTVIYLGYADGRANRSNATGVWNGYNHVWHLGQDPSGGSGAIRDTVGTADGSSQGSMTSGDSVAGVAGQGLDFDGIDDQITFANDITGSGAASLSGWVFQRADSGDEGACIVSIGDSSTNDARFLFSLDGNGNVKVGFYNSDLTLNSPKVATSAWSYLVWTWNGSNQSVIYLNGSSVLTSSHSGASTAGSVGRIGGDSFSSSMFRHYMTGVLDEVRIGSSARSSAQVAIEYANQRPDSTFLRSLAAAEAAPMH
jgi:hypothetical protein